MKAYKVELLVIDFNDIGSDSITSEIETARYGNRCINPEVKNIEERDIGEWSDDHLLNNLTSADKEYERLFNSNK